MEWFTAARKGRDDAFRQLLVEHHAPLFRFAYRLTGSVADAEDIVQECFLALLDPARSYDPRRTPVRTYLFGAVRNQALKRLRERKNGRMRRPRHGRAIPRDRGFAHGNGGGGGASRNAAAGNATGSPDPRAL
jgi:DNA-directed RNA polymerase specialized sigma24 family protein